MYTVIQQILTAAMARFGYEPVDTPIIEQANLFLTKAGDQVIDRLVTLPMHGAQWVMRPEFTAQAAAYYLTSGPETPQRWQFFGPVFSDGPNSQDAAPRFQRTNAGAELIGLAGPGADAEVIGLAWQALQTLRLTDTQVVIGHVGLTQALLAQFALDASSQRLLLNQRRRLHTEGVEAVRQVLRAQITTADESITGSAASTSHVLNTVLSHSLKGDVGTRSREDIAARLVRKQQHAAHRDQVMAALDFMALWSALRGPVPDMLPYIAENVQSNAAQQAFDSLRSTLKLLSAYGIQAEQMILQPDLARHWDYYTGVVFELQHSSGERLGGGGRYDDLTRLLGGIESVPAVGFALDIDRLAALRAVPSQYVIRVLLTADLDSQVAVAWAMALRAHGLHVRIVGAREHTHAQDLHLLLDGHTAVYDATRYALEDVDALAARLRAIIIGDHA